jgi:AraC family transcriptional regulator
MPDLASILRALDFVEAHLRQAVTLEAIAGAAGYSVYHFCRVFNTATHHTPYDYLMRRRLTEAAGEVLESERQLIEIAFDYQFNSPETFSRAFKRMFDRLPSQVRREGHLDRKRCLPPLREAYLLHLQERGCQFLGTERHEGRYLAGLMISLEEEERGEKIPALWQLVLGDGPDMESEPLYYGLTCHATAGETFYLAGIEIERLERAAPAQVVKWLPPLTWARFAHRGAADTLALSVGYIHHTWLAKSEHTLGYPVEVEHYVGAPPGHEKGILEAQIYVPLALDS